MHTRPHTHLPHTYQHRNTQLAPLLSSRLPGAANSPRSVLYYFCLTGKVGFLFSEDVFLCTCNLQPPWRSLYGVCSMCHVARRSDHQSQMALCIVYLDSARLASSMLRMVREVSTAYSLPISTVAVALQNTFPAAPFLPVLVFSLCLWLTDRL